MTSPVAWINGTLIPFPQAAVPVWDLGVVAGAAVTEMARTVRHRPFRLRQHLQRLADSCHALGLPLGWSLDDIEAAACRIVERNTGQISADDDLGIVVFVTAGGNPTYLQGQCPAVGTICVHTFPLPFSLWRDAVRNGVRLRIPSIRQIPEECLPVAHKVRNRLHWWLADREAAAAEPGSRALLTDLHDHLTETSTSCFYAVIGGEIITPPSHVLHSMSRRIVAQLAHDLGIPFRQTLLLRDRIPEFDEAFLSSTPTGLLSVRSIQGVPTGTADPGPIFTRLRAAWNDLAGLDFAQQVLSTANHPKNP